MPPHYSYNNQTMNAGGVEWDEVGGAGGKQVVAFLASVSVLITLLYGCYHFHKCNLPEFQLLCLKHQLGSLKKSPSAYH